MKNITITKVADLSQVVGADTLDGLPIKDWGGVLVEIIGRNEEGHAEPLKDYKLFLPTDGVVADCSGGDGWRTCDMEANEYTAEMFAEQCRLCDPNVKDGEISEALDAMHAADSFLFRSEDVWRLALNISDGLKRGLAGDTIATEEDYATREEAVKALREFASMCYVDEWIGDGSGLHTAAMVKYLAEHNTTLEDATDEEMDAANQYADAECDAYVASEVSDDSLYFSSEEGSSGEIKHIKKYDDFEVVVK